MSGGEKGSTSIRTVCIGENCFIGGGSKILPGGSVHDGANVGAGAIVFDDVPTRCAVAGNPAQAILTDLRTGRLRSPGLYR